MIKIVKEEESGYYFAALKLIQQLYVDGKISELVFKNIINEYADEIDVSSFSTVNSKEAKDD